MSLSNFDGLGLPGELTRALRAQHITEPFAIQALTLPDALAGRDILGRAPTGSGKTLAFGLPVLTRVAATDRAERRRPRALILSPTRELAEQIQRELAPLAKAVKRRVVAVYGGAAAGRQIAALHAGADVLVACPGRLLDLISQGEVALDAVEIAVVDEADRMADMGFLPDVRRILDQTAPDRQTLLFSATLDGDVQALTDRYQHEPVLCEIGEAEPDLSLMEHRFYEVPKARRLGVVVGLTDGAGPTMVFVRTRHGVDRLARQLRQNGVRAGFIHGGRTQSQRTRALELFTDGKVDVLVATDVAARGIHVDGVASVIHYDPPADTKDYVHRSGRTARAGATGTVVSLLDPAQVTASKRMQRDLGIDADLQPAPPSDLPDRPAASASAGHRHDESRPAAPAGRRRSRRSSGPGPSRGRRANADGPPNRGHRASADAPLGGRRPAEAAGDATAAAARDDARPSRKPKHKGRRPAGGASGKADGTRPGKAKAKRRATKRSGRPRPPNRKGGAKAKKR